jgi:hypothetical protein
MLLRSPFRNLSLLPLCYLYNSISLLRPLTCSRSIPPIHFFDPFHQSLPLCIFHLVFGFSFLIPPLLSPISCSSFPYSPVDVPFQEYTIFTVFLHCVFDTSSCCLHPFTVYCHYFPPFIAYMDFSFHAFFSSPFSFRFSLIPNFTLFSFPFLLLDLPICSDFSLCGSFSVSVFFVSTFLFSFSLYPYSPVYLLFFCPFSKNFSSVSPLSHPIQTIPRLSVSSSISLFSSHLS